MIETNDYMTDDEPLLEIARAWAVVFPQLADVVARIEARLEAIGSDILDAEPVAALDRIDALLRELARDESGIE